MAWHGRPLRHSGRMGLFVRFYGRTKKSRMPAIPLGLLLTNTTVPGQISIKRVMLHISILFPNVTLFQSAFHRKKTTERAAAATRTDRLTGRRVNRHYFVLGSCPLGYEWRDIPRQIRPLGEGLRTPSAALGSAAAAATPRRWENSPSMAGWVLSPRRQWTKQDICG
ncbi:hypothetical protein BX600DRAFT_11371 [Xylariales sp. PMI_506]|nr:hypothetical protein BX600DRAFT_11371 [Xylariales sp. PMI_506]